VEQEVRARLEQVIAPDKLPGTGSLSLFHIRGVGNDGPFGGEDKDVVIYGPEFLYVYDVGWPALPAVEIGFDVSGKGDPHFPDFSDWSAWSVESAAPNHVLFPSAPGKLLIGVVEGTPEATVRQGLAAFTTRLEILIPSLYLAQVKPFQERVIARRIEQEVGFVRYASLDGRTRLVDFSPGWFVDRIC